MEIKKINYFLEKKVQRLKNFDPEYIKKINENLKNKLK